MLEARLQKDRLMNGSVLQRSPGPGIRSRPVLRGPRPGPSPYRGATPGHGLQLRIRGNWYEVMRRPAVRGGQGAAAAAPMRSGLRPSGFLICCGSRPPTIPAADVWTPEVPRSLSLAGGQASKFPHHLPHRPKSAAIRDTSSPFSRMEAISWSKRARSQSSMRSPMPATRHCLLSPA